MKIWLVILSDRHCDDTYKACRTLSAAKAVADKMMAAYGNRYTWENEGDHLNWYYRHSCGEDCPDLHIEELEVDHS